MTQPTHQLDYIIDWSGINRRDTVHCELTGNNAIREHGAAIFLTPSGWRMAPDLGRPGLKVRLNEIELARERTYSVGPGCKIVITGHDEVSPKRTITIKVLR